MAFVSVYDFTSKSAKAIAGMKMGVRTSKGYATMETLCGMLGFSGLQVKEFLINGTTHIALKSLNNNRPIVINTATHPEIFFESPPDYDKWKNYSII